MIRGTAQPFKLILPYSLSELEWITIEFSQANNPNLSPPIIKTKVNCSEVRGAIYVSLDANETKKFSDKYKAKLQLRAQPIFGVPFGSLPELITVYPMSDNIMDPDIENENGSSTTTPGGLVYLDGGPIIGE